ncbi:alpha/beta hydrolase [Gaopeijia maritima]|uniref:Alpha/beta fold hydrolase n=1 Tax=Gaopeijia maritima TaxID=3119007 RepID=A0ABU9E4A1_9BACT
MSPDSPPADSAARLALDRPAAAPRAVLALCSGSGRQDRDQTVAGHPTFRILRDELTARGFAAASWDDPAHYARCGPDDLVADAEAMLDRVERALPGVPVVLVGHSQGAWIATRLAARRPSPTGLILLAGAARDGRTVLEAQHRRITRAEGWSAAATEATLAWKTTCFDLLARVDASPLDPPAEADLRASLRAVLESHGVHENDLDPIVDDLLEWEWRFILRHDAAAALARVPCPTLALAGSADLQIEATAELCATRDALERGVSPDVEVGEIPHLDHLFARAHSAPASEYETGGRPFDAAVLERMVNWLARILPPHRQP